MKPSELLPERTDIQGALEHAYKLLLDHPKQPPTPVDKPDRWAIEGSLVLGPILWLAKTYDRLDVLEWVANPPSPSASKMFYNSITATSEASDDLNNVQSRLQVHIAQDTPNAAALLAWLPHVLADHRHAA